MATAEQLKALLKSYNEGDEERFFATAIQVGGIHVAPARRREGTAISVKRKGAC